MAGNRAIIKTFNILEAIANHPDGLTLSEIVKETKLPKSTVFDILESLYETDAIYFKDRYRKTYVIGSRLFAVGQAYTINSNLIINASDLLNLHSEKYETNCEIYKRVENRIVCVKAVSPSTSRLTPTQVGANKKLFDCEAGLTFLAFLSEDEKESSLKKLEPLVKEKILNNTKKIHDSGFSIDKGTRDDCVYTYTVPIFNFENRIVGVIASSKIRNTSNGLENEIQDFIEIGKQISKRQGYRN